MRVCSACLRCAMLRPHVHRISELAADAPIPLLERRRVIGEKAMLSHVVLRKGCVVGLHRHENEQFTVVLSGCLRYRFGAPGEVGVPEPVTLRAGEVVHLPPNLAHGADALEDTVVLDIFSPPSATTGIDHAHGS